MPVQTSYPGVYVVEEPSSVHTIVGVPTSVAAFVGWAPRGPVNTATRINNWTEYERVFGGFDSRSHLSYAVYLFFVNGGSAAQVVRADGLPPDPTKPDDKPPILAKPAIIKVDDRGLGTLKPAFPVLVLAAKSPGGWGDQLVVKRDIDGLIPPHDPTPADKNDKATKGDTRAFNLTVVDNSTRRTERFTGITPAAGPGGLEVALDVALRASALVRRAAADEIPKAADAGKEQAPQEPRPEDEAKKKDGPPPPLPPLSKGADPSPDAVDVVAGWRALSPVDIFNMLVLPTAPTATLSAETLSKAAGFCQKHRAVLLVDPPKDWQDGVLTFQTFTTKPAVTGAGLDSAAIYYPNVIVTDHDTGLSRTCGPSGAVAGVWARTDTARGVWKAPAGTQAALTGIADLSVPLIDSDIGVLNPLAVNCLKTIPFAGPVVWGARTMDGADQVGSQWKYLPVRRTALFIEESLLRGTQWAVFEPNDEPLWAALRLNIGSFMNSLFRQGAFQGSTPSEAYLVKCDAENNPQNDIDRGIVNILVGFAPLKPAEFVIIHIEQLAGQLQT